MEKLTETIYRVRIPLPFALRAIYTYAIKGSNGWTIIDTGLHSDDSKAVWEDFLNQQNSDWTDIEKIVLTHNHPDHYGAAGWLQEKSGAPVYISEADGQLAHHFWHSGYDMGRVMRNFYILHGMPVELADQMIPHIKDFTKWVKPAPVVTVIKENDTIYLGDDEYIAIATPGHSDGHICYYQKEKKILFSGDHILPKITPNVSLWPEATDRNPLKSFIASLNKIKGYDIDITYPAHKKVCIDVKERIHHLLIHHDERLNKVMQWVGDEATGYQVCEKMFGVNLSVHDLRFAMAETLAHLVYLEGEGRLASKMVDDVIYWLPKGE